MALPQSSLALLARRVSDSLDKLFKEGNTSQVQLHIGPPNVVHELVKAGTNTTHHLNLFFYRVTQSGFHAAARPGEDLLVRLHCLVTPFGMANPPEFSSDLQILGAVLAHFHNAPRSDELLLDSDGNGFSVQSTLLQPNMEELNHIWTTQGTDAAYRLSAAYEFSLLPVDPPVRVEPAPPVETAHLSVQGDPETWGGPDALHGANRFLRQAPAEDWRPLLSFVQDGQLRDRLDLRRANLPAQLPLALAGRPGGQVMLDLVYRDERGERLGGSTTVQQAITAAAIDSATARLDLDFVPPANAVLLSVTARPQGVPAERKRRVSAPIELGIVP